jgi:hypothetical protein
MKGLRKYPPVCQILGSQSGKYEDNVFWDVAPYSLIENDRRLRGAYSSP